MLGRKVDGQILFFFFSSGPDLRNLQTWPYRIFREQSTWKSCQTATECAHILYFWVIVDISEYWKWLDDQTCSQVGRWRCGCQSSSLAPSPISCTQLRKTLLLISSPSDAAKPRFLVKVIKMERNCVNAYGIFSPRGLTGVKYDSNSEVTEGFDPSIRRLAEEEPHCKKPKGQPVDHSVSGQKTPRAGCKKDAGTGSLFLQWILSTSGSHCLGTSWPRGYICVFVFNSSQWTLLPWIGLISPLIFLASITSDGNESHSVVMCFVKKRVCVWACVLNPFPLLSTSCNVRNKEGMSHIWLIRITRAVMLSHSN